MVAIDERQIRQRRLAAMSPQERLAFLADEQREIEAKAERERLRAERKQRPDSSPVRIRDGKKVLVARPVNPDAPPPLPPPPTEPPPPTVRDKILDLSDVVKEDALGNSVAQQQLRRQFQRLTAQQQAQAAGARGAGIGAAQANAARNVSTLGSEQNLQSAIVRAQEIEAANKFSATLLANVRDQDTRIGLANLQAQLQKRGLDQALIAQILAQQAQALGHGDALTQATFAAESGQAAEANAVKGGLVEGGLNIVGAYFGAPGVGTASGIGGGGGGA